MDKQITPAAALATIIATAGGRTRAFAAMRLAGFSNKQIALVVGNRGGAPTIAYALTNNLRKKAMVDGNDARERKNCELTCAALGIEASDAELVNICLEAATAAAEA